MPYVSVAFSYLFCLSVLLPVWYLPWIWCSCMLYTSKVYGAPAWLGVWCYCLFSTFEVYTVFFCLALTQCMVLLQYLVATLGAKSQVQPSALWLHQIKCKTHHLLSAGNAVAYMWFCTRNTAPHF